MRDRLARHPVDAFLDDEIHLGPADIGKSAPQTLRPLRLAAAGADYFLDRNGQAADHPLQFRNRIGKIDAENGLGVRMDLDLEAEGFEGVEHGAPRKTSDSSSAS